MLREAAVVVLQEIKIEPDLAKNLAVPRFEEKTAGISEDLRFEQPRIVDFGRKFFHEQRGAWSQTAASCLTQRAARTPQ